MARRNLTEAEAFRFLQRQSQDRRMPMAKLAESIVQADELLEGAAASTPANAAGRPAPAGRLGTDPGLPLRPVPLVRGTPLTGPRSPR